MARTLTPAPAVLARLVCARIPFGKYQGRLVADLPEPYLLWFAAKGLPKGELGELMGLCLEVKQNGLMGLLDPLRPSKE